jgi:TPR repeat protein
VDRIPSTTGVRFHRSNRQRQAIPIDRDGIPYLGDVSQKNFHYDLRCTCEEKLSMLRGGRRNAGMFGFGRTRSAIAAAAVGLVAATSAHAGFDDAMAAHRRGDYGAALEQFRALAAAGDPSAMNNVGMMYALGQGVPQDYKAAADWYMRSAQKGHLGAINNLGVMFELGQGVAKDYAQAAKWYDLAARYGFSDAQYNLAALYAAGKGVEKDHVEAYMWYSLAAGQGDKDAAKERDALGKAMTASQLALARKKAQNWKPQR